MADNTCKYYKLVKQVSYNSGQTWSNVDPPQYQQGDLYESGSTDCPSGDTGSTACTTTYRWIVINENESMCENGIAHQVEHRQVSVDCGPWVNVEPEETRLGEARTIEESMDCFKYYCNNGNDLPQKWAECDDYNTLTNQSWDAYYEGYISFLPDYRVGQYDVYVGNCVEILANRHSGTFYRAYNMARCILPSNLQRIDAETFFQCNSLKTIEIPDSVWSIGNSVFRCCPSLESVKLPSGLTSISDYAFAGRYTDGTSYSEIIGVNQIESIGISNSGADLELPNYIEYIGEGAFYYSLNLKSVVLPNSVTKIGTEAFDVTSIAVGTFEACSSLTSVTIPNTVTSIGKRDFRGCTSLTSINLPNSITNIRQDTFRGCSSLTNITIPSSVTTIAGGAFSGCRSLTSITIPNSVTTIGTPTPSIDELSGDSFSYCTSLASVSIGSGVTWIGGSTFRGCTSLTSITIPSGVTLIGDNAFRECTSLTSITINAVTPPTLGGLVFDDTNNCPIYVPSESVSAYQLAWRGYVDTSRIQAIP